jgi:glycine betaine/proline transport system substrate-binding protein
MKVFANLDQEVIAEQKLADKTTAQKKGGSGMQTRIGRIVGLGLLISILTVSLAVPVMGANSDALKFGVVPWSESLAVGSLITYILEQEIGQPVEMINPDIGVAYQAMINGDLDLFVESWLYVTHEAYWEESAAKLRDFGPIYEDALLCWAVPNYVPEDVVSSVTDLGKQEVWEKMNGEIIGIDPGSGLMQHSSVMMEDYPELANWKLIESSDAAMIAELKRRMLRNEWTVVTLWQPHSAFGRFDIRVLDEPRKILGVEEEVHMVGRQDFTAKFGNDVSTFLSRFYLTIDQMSELTLLYEEDEATAATIFMEKYPKLIHYFVTGEID